ncbi:hypothetical protein [Flavobacterium sp.]|uniref:hypothetical protein n=1 Tax=Flavobacterium sp. TaxID=239 RepID=UPI0031DE63E0
MSTNHFSEEVEIRLKDFFTDFIDPKDMAKMIRQVNYSLALCSMRGCETIESGLPNIDDNFYWMNRLAEILHPYLEVE